MKRCKDYYAENAGQVHNVFKLLSSSYCWALSPTPSVESPYNNADDPTTTRMTTITGSHPSMTSKPEKGPGLVVEPPSKNPVNLSPNAKAALNAFQSTLGILGQTPIPGIKAVTAALLQVVKGIQVRTCSSRVFRTSSCIMTHRFYLHIRKYLKSRQAGKT